MGMSAEDWKIDGKAWACQFWVSVTFSKAELDNSPDDKNLRELVDIKCRNTAASLRESILEDLKKLKGRKP